MISTLYYGVFFLGSPYFSILGLIKRNEMGYQFDSWYETYEAFYELIDLVENTDE
jgi:hypothetical protein